MLFADVRPIEIEIGARSTNTMKIMIVHRHEQATKTMKTIIRLNSAHHIAIGIEIVMRNPMILNSMIAEAVFEIAKDQQINAITTTTDQQLWVVIWKNGDHIQMDESQWIHRQQVNESIMIDRDMVMMTNMFTMIVDNQQ